MGVLKICGLKIQVKNFDPKKILEQKIVGTKNFLVQKCLGQKSKKIGYKKIFGEKNIRLKRSFVKKNVGPQKLRPPKYWVQKVYTISFL